MRGTDKTKSIKNIKNYLKNKNEKYYAEYWILPYEEKVDDSFVALIFACPDSAKNDEEDQDKRGYRLKKIFRKTHNGIVRAAEKETEKYQEWIERVYEDLENTVSPEDLSFCMATIMIDRVDDRHKLFIKPEGLMGKLIKKFGKEVVLSEINKLPKKIDTISYAMNYLRKVLTSKENSGKISDKKAKKRDFNIKDLY